MSTYATGSVGPQPGLSQQQFLPLMAPIHLPTLASAHGADTPHLPVAHHTAALEVSGINDTLPLRTGFDFGTQEEFQYLSNTSEILTSCTLVVNLSPLTDSNSAATLQARYADDVLNQAMEKCEWMYGSQSSTHTIYGEENHFSMMQETGDIELDRKMLEQAAGLSVAERAARALALQEVKMELPFYWSRQNAGHWHSYALGRPLKIRITWRSADYILQQNTAVKPLLKTGYTTFINSKWLHFNTAIPTEATKSVYLSKVEATGDHGWLQLFKDVQKQEFTMVQTATTASLRLDMITRYGYNVRFVVRPSANLSPDYSNNERWICYSIADASFEISNKIFFPKTSDYDLKHEINAKKFLGNHELPIYNIPLCAYPDMHTQAMGGIEFSNTSLPILKLTTAALPVACTVTVWVYVHNYVRTVIKGTNSATETLQPI